MVDDVSVATVGLSATVSVITGYVAALINHNRLYNRNRRVCGLSLLAEIKSQPAGQAVSALVPAPRPLVCRFAPWATKYAPEYSKHRNAVQYARLSDHHVADCHKERSAFNRPLVAFDKRSVGRGRIGDQS